MASSFEQFWKSAPALFYGLLFFLGIVLALSFHPAYLIPLSVCLGTYRHHLIKGVCVVIGGVLWAHFSYTLPVISEEGIEGKGVFKVESVSLTQSPFQKTYLFRGILQQFSTAGHMWKHIPCHIYFSPRKFRPQASTDFQIEGRLIPKGHHRYVLKPTTMKKIPSTFSLAQWRYTVKNQLRTYLASHIPHAKSLSFLLSMLTGEIDDRLLALEFNRLGLLHLLGVSGFQFALLAFLLGVGLRCFLPYTSACVILMIMLTTYAFILGDSPPIDRAWVGSMLYLSALLLGYRTSALNALGVGLLWLLFKDPLLIFHLGFQFTFLCTLAILTTYPCLKSLLSTLLPSRAFKDVLQMPLFEQHGHLLSFFFKETLALNGAIHLVTLPLILYHFHKFCLLSLLYNLFLPAAVSVVYIFLVLGMVAGVSVPFLGSIFLCLTQQAAEVILHIASHPPALYDFQWRVHDFPLSAAVGAITLIWILSVGNFSLFQQTNRIIHRALG